MNDQIGTKLIITEFYDGQGLGNQLWVYVVTRCIAKKLNLPFLILAPERFKGIEFLELDMGEIGLTRNVLEKQKNGQLHIFKETMYLDLELDCFSVDFDERVLSVKPYTKIDGYFQSEKYFFDDFEYFKTLLPIKNEWLNRNFMDENTCVLNIRGGEYLGVPTLILPKSYWENAMQNMKKTHPKIKEFVIVTDDREYCQYLFPDLRLIEAGIAQSYLALHQAKYIIVSNSSFSYFPIKTQQQKPFVIAPRHWARFNNPWKRWSSPANLYTDWSWQDADGKLFGYQECIEEYNENINYFQTHYNIRTTSEISAKFAKPFSWKQLIPKSIKTVIKNLLPYRIRKGFKT